MKTTESTKELAAALAKAQVQFAHISRDKHVTVRTRTGGSYSFSYAPLESIMSAIKTALSTNGLALMQDIREGKVCTILLHASGEAYVSTGTVINVAETGAQAYGSGLTYARRYDLSLTLGLCPDDDDDGNAADGNTASPAVVSAPITPTEGAWKDVPQEDHERLRRIGNGIIDYFSAEEPGSAYAYLVEQSLTNEAKVAIWTMLSAPMRSALKKLDKDAREKASA